MTFGTVAILGPGLIGGSLALALAERGLADKLVIYARTDKSFSAIKAKLPQAELTTDVVAAVSGADVIVLCVPIETMGALVKQFADHLKPTALVTDVGSVKGSVEKEVAPLLAGKAHWIGSHPMAGSEQAGFSVARSDLFVGAPIVVTPTERTNLEASLKAVQFWESLGGGVVSTTPRLHDDRIAQISHLPHLLAAVLVNHATTQALALAAGGFRDTTRIASGSPELWSEILFANAEEVSNQIGHLIHDLGVIKDCLERPNESGSKRALLGTLKTAQAVRSSIFQQKRPPE